jgi:uncharacterized protein (DUF2062 family)
MGLHLFIPKTLIVKIFSLDRGVHPMKFRDHLAAWLRDESSMEKLAVSLALGAVLGVFPVVGVPTLLCGAVAAMWRLNFPALQLMNYVVYPLQIALWWPFTQFGRALFGVSHHLRGLAGLMAMAFHTAAAWLCFAVPAGLLLYLALRFFLLFLGTKSRAVPKLSSVE